MIKLDAVTVIRQGRPTLDGVSFAVHPGEQWALIGPNGAGKSTLLSICAAVTMPTHGDADIFGQRLGTVDKSELRRRIGYVTNHHQLEWPLTALAIVLTAFTNTLETPMRWEPTEEQSARAREQLQRFGLGEQAQTPWMKLSQGELARMLLARALLIPPALLLLDEPAAGLDLGAREQVLDLLASLTTENPQLATVLITHHLEELPTSTTHAALMQRGRILASGPAAAVLTTENISAAFARPIAVDFAHGRWSTRSLS
jgi:iron complex transport system ATP-binding protein